MHSVVVMGDYRSHLLRSKISSGRESTDEMHSRHQEITGLVQGGFVFMARTIQAALKQHPDKDRPQVFAHHEDPDSDPVFNTADLFSDLCWDVRAHDNDSTLQSWRLWDPTRPTRTFLKNQSADAPLPALNLVEALLPNGVFEDPATSDFPECPDIVVLDDLRKWFCDPLNSALHDRAGKPIAPTDVLKRYVNWMKQDPRKRPARATVSNLTTLRAIRLKLFDRLTECARQQEHQTKTGLEPVIVCSLMGTALPQTWKDPGRTISATEETYWDRLRNSAWLRDRTIVLLDARDLRDIPDIPGISYERSWERTAQDAITAMKSSSRLRPLLDFGHVILRFGVTGALVFSRPAFGDTSATLFFDPARNDETWARQHRDGHVLGYSAVVVASMVNTLTQICGRRKGFPLQADLTEAVNIAVSQSIIRQQYLCLHGYGFGKGRDGHSVFDSLASQNWLPQNLFASDLPTESEEDIPDVSDDHWRDHIVRHVQRVAVPPTTMPNWSILRQSTHAKVKEVAQELALGDVSKVINQPPLDPALMLYRLANQTGAEFVGTLLYGLFFEPLNAEELAIEILSDAVTALAESSTLFGDRAMDREEYVFELLDFKARGDELVKLITTNVAEIIAKSSKWKMFDHHLLEESLAPASEKLILEVLEWTRTLTRSTNSSSVEMEPVVAPIVRFGKFEPDGKDRRMVVIDRREIEGFTAIQSLLSQHFEQVKEKRTKRPLSIGVFGPPGAGKSSAVKNIIRGLGMKNIRELECNLSQLTSYDNLADHFGRIVDTLAEKQLPIMFFDEFDSKFAGDDLGWLKFFLSPMEDGKVAGRSVGNETKAGGTSISDAVFVFAGGTSSSFANFNLSPTDDGWQLFKLAKGPDFVSRLSKPALDIVGINPAEDEDDELFLIRRAVSIRWLLNEKGIESVDVDRDVLRAILSVDTYEYGGRTLRMLVEACTDEQRRITKSSVPPPSSIETLIKNSKAFFENLTPASR